MIQVHSTLSPQLWKDDSLLPEIRSQLLKIAKLFYKTLKIKTPPEDVTLTGSSANFNYTPDSDIDLHILLDFKKINCEVDFTKEYFLSKKSLWNNEHSITIKGRDVELYVQDVNESHSSTGVYSILNNKWLVTPSAKNFYLRDINKEEFKHKFNHIKSLIDFNLTHKSNLSFLKKIKDNILNMRKKGLKRGGETDIKNLIFKELRNRNYIDKLSKAITHNTDKQLSIESFINYINEKI